MRKFSLIVAISMSLPASVAHAQEGVRAEPSTSDMLQVMVRDDPRPALAERLVQMTLRGMDKFTQEMLTRQLAGAEGVMPEEQARWLRRNAGPIADSNLRSLVDAIIHEYATRFTEAELNALIAFYGGPLGQDIARKQMEANSTARAKRPRKRPRESRRAVDFLAQPCIERGFSSWLRPWRILSENFGTWGPPAS